MSDASSGEGPARRDVPRRHRDAAPRPRSRRCLGPRRRLRPTRGSRCSREISSARQERNAEFGRPTLRDGVAIGRPEAARRRTRPRFPTRRAAADSPAGSLAGCTDRYPRSKSVCRSERSNNPLSTRFSPWSETVGCAQPRGPARCDRPSLRIVGCTPPGRGRNAICRRQSQEEIVAVATREDLHRPMVGDERCAAEPLDQGREERAVSGDLGGAAKFRFQVCRTGYGRGTLLGIGSCRLRLR